MSSNNLYARKYQIQQIEIKTLKNKIYKLPYTLNIIPIPMIMVICLLSFTNELQSQNTLQYPINTNKIEIGITAGLFFVFYTDLELNVTINRRVSNLIVLEAKPVLGLITQLYLFEGNQSRYRLTYGGATIGANFGKRNRFFEITTGYAYFYSSTNPWGDQTNGFKPIGTMAFKKVGTKKTFRIGIGFPHGLFLGLNF